MALASSKTSDADFTIIVYIFPLFMEFECHKNRHIILENSKMMCLTF